MNKLTAEKCREQFEYWAKSFGREPDLTRANGGANYAISEIDVAWLAWKASRQALEIAVPVLEQKTHESVIAEQLEAVMDSMTLNLHQTVIIGCAIDRLNELSVRVHDLSRSLQEQQESPTDTYRQIENDVWIEWAGGDCPVSPCTIVTVKLFDGSIWHEYLAKEWDWHNTTNLDHIIAYRVIENDGREG